MVAGIRIFYTKAEWEIDDFHSIIISVFSYQPKEQSDVGYTWKSAMLVG